MKENKECDLDEQNEEDPRYNVVYDMEFEFKKEGFTPEEVQDWNNGDGGACDAFIFHSICFPKDGEIARTEQLITFDGRTGMDLDSEGLLKAWAAMTFGMGANPELQEDERKFFERMGELYLKRFWPDIWARRMYNKSLRSPEKMN